MLFRPSSLPDSTFFEGHPRATLLRATGLAGAEAFLAAGQGDEEAVGPLLDANQRLRQLGIVARMGTLRGRGFVREFRRSRLLRDPVRLSEWACGQLVEVFDKTVAVSPPDPSILREHDVFAGEYDDFDNAPVVGGNMLPAPMREYLVSMHAVSVVVDLLGGRPAEGQE